MGRTACTEPQCLYKGDLYLYPHKKYCIRKICALITLDSILLDSSHSSCVSVIEWKEINCTFSAALLAARNTFNRLTYVAELLCVQ